MEISPSTRINTTMMMCRAELRQKTSALPTARRHAAGDRLLVPISSIEEAAAMSKAYACCTFRGSVKGERRSLRRGHSVEFCDYRAYGVGDDLRHVDWNIYGRLDRLHVKLFVDEEDLCLHLIVDASASMNFGTPSKLECAVRIAAALGFVGLGAMGSRRTHDDRLARGERGAEPAVAAHQGGGAPARVRARAQPAPPLRRHAVAVGRRRALRECRGR